MILLCYTFPSSLQFFGANSEQNKPYMAANVSIPLGLAPTGRTVTSGMPQQRSTLQKRRGKICRCLSSQLKDTQSANVYHTAYKKKPQICTKCP